MQTVQIPKKISIKIRIKMKNTTQNPFKRKWTYPIDNNGKFHWDLMNYGFSRKIKKK